MIFLLLQFKKRPGYLFAQSPTSLEATAKWLGQLEETIERKTEVLGSSVVHFLPKELGQLTIAHEASSQDLFGMHGE